MTHSSSHRRLILTDGSLYVRLLSSPRSLATNGQRTLHNNSGKLGNNTSHPQARSVVRTAYQPTLHTTSPPALGRSMQPGCSSTVAPDETWPRRALPNTHCANRNHAPLSWRVSSSSSYFPSSTLPSPGSSAATSHRPSSSAPARRLTRYGPYGTRCGAQQELALNAQVTSAEKQF